MDLMDMVKGAVTKQVMGKIGGLLGTDEAKTNSAFETAAGSILGGLIKKSGTAQGARDIFDMTQKQDTGVLDKLGDLLGGGNATEEFQKQGGGLLDGIFGGQQQTTGLLGTLGNFLGFKGGVTGMLMKLVAPIVMGVIAKHVKAKALDAVGLGSFLGQQKKSLGFMPSSLTSDLGFGNLLGNVTGAAGDAGRAVTGAASSAVGAAGDVAGSAGRAVSGAAGNAGRAVSGAAGNAASAVSGAAGDTASAGAGIIKLLLPLILLGALLFGAYKFLPTLTGAAGNAANAVGDAASGAAGAVGDVASGAAGAVGDVASGAAGAVGDAASGAAGAVSGSGLKMPEIPGMDFGSIPGFDMGSLGAAGPALTNGFGEISQGFAGLATSGTDGATALAEKITGFTGSIDGMGLDKLEGVGKSSAMGLIGKFVEMVKGLMGGQSEGIQGILQPSVDGLMQKLGPMIGM